VPEEKILTTPWTDPTDIYYKAKNKLEGKELKGLLKVRIIPPKNLYYPIIPKRIGKNLKHTICYLYIKGKTLIFCICHICATKLMDTNDKIFCVKDDRCAHNEEERYIANQL